MPSRKLGRGARKRSTEDRIKHPEEGKQAMNYESSARKIDATAYGGLDRNVYNLGSQSRARDAAMTEPEGPLPAFVDAPFGFDKSSLTRSDLVMEFLAITERTRGRSVGKMMADVLRKSRELTRAEAGSIFILRHGRGDRRTLEAASVQNDALRVEAADFTVPVNTTSIAGYVAETGETLIITISTAYRRNCLTVLTATSTRPAATAAAR